MPSSVAERVESVKAGVVSALVFSLVSGITIIVNHFVLLGLLASWQPKQIISLADLLVRLAIAIGSGFLFGVTYRYLIRGDNNNLHLQDGVVFAFALVRGLALIEGTNPSFFWLAIIIENIFSFATARLSLDYALELRLIRPLKLENL